MGQNSPFILLDDARDTHRDGGAAPAHLFENPREVFIARRKTKRFVHIQAANTTKLVEINTGNN